jgi:hypothetical protein
MVELTERRSGANVVGNRIFLASCTSGGGRLLIDTLKEIDISSEKKKDSEKTGDLYFGVSEKEAVIKRVKIPQAVSLDQEKLALFEFLASLPGNEDSYYLETFDLNGRPERLAVAYNRELVRSRIDQFSTWLSAPSGFRLRSLSLASAFINYCHPKGGDMICLLDLSGEDLTFCILNRSHAVTVGYLPNDYIRLEKELYDTRRFLTDLSAVLQFHLSLLFSGGHSAPLSLLILSGTEATTELADLIGEKLKIKTLLPEFLPRLFVEDLLPSAHRYFVSLGLTAGF